MNTRDIADRLDTDPRTLRKFLRADPEYVNAGCGGKYDFTAKDIPRLKKRFALYKSGGLKKPRVEKPKPAPKPARKPSLQEELVGAGLPITILRMRMTESARQQRDMINAAREARLIQALKETGLYLGA